MTRMELVCHKIILGGNFMYVSVLNFYLKNIRLVLKTTQKVCVVSMVNDLEKK